jgi:SAM-dependent methyltransferase
MQTVQDFFNKYRIQEFYNWQKSATAKPIRPFDPLRHKKLSFGIIPGFKNYDLFYERYLSGVTLLKESGIVKPDLRILDIGSGEGFFKFFFDALCDEKIEWHGIEIWKERAEFCRHIGYKIEEVNLEKDDLPFDNEQFDVVLASHVIEHLPDPVRIIREMCRVLKIGGILLVATPTKPPLVAEIDAFFHNLHKRGLGETQQAFTHKKLEKLILKTLQLPKKSIIDKRGFRIISGRKKLPFENWKWFYTLSVYLGRKLLFLVPEVNIIVRKEN